MANAWLLKPLPFSATGGGTAAGYSPANIGNDYAGVVWQSTGVAGPYLIMDLGSDQPIDTVALFGLSGFTAAHTVFVAVATAAQGGSFGASAYTTFASAQVLAGSVMPTSGRGVGLFSVPTPITGRYVLLQFNSLTVPVQVARAVVGQRFQPYRNFGFGGSFGVRDLGSADYSARGVLLRRRAKKLRTVALTFSNVQKDEVEGMVKPLLEQIGNTETVALIADPDPHAQRMNRCYFGTLVGDLGQTQRNSRGWETKINLVSVF